MVKIIKTDSYFNVFPLLTDSLKGASKEIGRKNLIFCEEKISLMAERWVTESLGGTFNTEVYSFGSFLLKNKTFNSLLSREGSSMVIKKILLEAPLSCFNKSKATMSSALYDLLILLKSASVTPKDLLNAGESIEGILKNKLTDIHTVFSAYQEYLIENGLEDQSGQLDYLPEVIENYNGIEKANVYVIGYNGFTAQIRKVIKTLINKASSFTAILPYGENEFAFVNETALAIKKISQEANQKVVEQFIVTKREKEAEHIVRTIFSPDFITKTPIETQKIHVHTAKSESEEFEKIACVIEQKVRSEGLKYKNFSVILPDVSGKDELIKAFNLIGVPYFIDDKVTVMNHPLVTLLLSYLEIFRKNFNRKDYLSFVKNPLITQDKSLSDRYENYIYKYDLDYSAFKKPFTKDDLETEEMERLRLRVNSYLDYFSPVKLFEKIGALQTLNFLSEKLKEKARSEEVSINEQIYDYVTRIINEIKSILGEDKITLIEYKNLLISGLSAIKLSIIPQYNDAVFVGGFKEVGLYQTDYVFLPQLTSGVPSFKEDVAILSDNDLSLLSNLNLIVEPKIQVANHRLREETAMGLTCFKKGLFLSYSISPLNGSQNTRSELFDSIVRAFKVTKFPETDGYVSRAQGLKSYSIEIGEFVHGGKTDIEDATAFRSVINDETTDRIANASRKELKVRLEKDMGGELTSIAPTTLESYYTCPYRTFVEKILRVTERKTGKLDAPQFGTVVHEILFEFIKNLSKVTDENFSEFFANAVKKVTDKKVYSAFQGEGEKAVTFDALIKEAEKYCKRNYEWFEGGNFTTDEEHLEVNFGGDKMPKDFKKITFDNGRVRLKGVIDRVDFYGDYARIIDYKTGKSDDSFKALFTGEKLQLYLYALALKEKKLAGAYYMPIIDEYSSEENKQGSLVIGNTLEDDEILSANDENFRDKNESEYLPVKMGKYKLLGTLKEEEMSSLTEYARQMGERAVEQMKDGIVVASPLDKACDYCAYHAVCGLREENVRKVKRVTDGTVTKAILGEEND